MLKFALDPLFILLFMNHNIAYTQSSPPSMCQSHYLLSSGDNYSKCDTLLGLDYFDEEAKCYGRLFEFCQVTFCRSRQWGRCLWQNFNNLPSILPPPQNNPAAVITQTIRLLFTQPRPRLSCRIKYPVLSN